MYKELGINSELFLPWYDKDLFKATKKTIFKYDVVFVGHYENDIRLECLKHLHIKGLKIGLFGPIEKVHSGWKSALIDTELEYLLKDLRYLNLEEYYNILRQSKVALCFFSKRNNDVYTRRSFEIPASGTIMLSEYSDEISKIFLPDLDSFYFKDLESFKNQVDIIFSNEFDLNKIENNIINKLKQIKMSNYDRANELIEYLKKIN
jgi:spore maturation protein CgeB